MHDLGLGLHQNAFGGIILILPMFFFSFIDRPGSRDLYVFGEYREDQVECSCEYILSDSLPANLPEVAPTGWRSDEALKPTLHNKAEGHSHTRVKRN